MSIFERFERRALLILFAIVIMMDGLIMAHLATQQGGSFVANTFDAWRSAVAPLHISR
ncbi:MAG TPA: hypothetical protein VF803_00865 [Candidatus Paceibacterota bacterium]